MSSKRIVFTATDNGVDGKAPTKVIFASYIEEERDEWVAAAKNKNYYGTGETIVHIEKAREKAIAKLDAVDMLVLGYGHLQGEREGARR